MARIDSPSDLRNRLGEEPLQSLHPIGQEIRNRSFSMYKKQTSHRLHNLLHHLWHRSWISYNHLRKMNILRNRYIPLNNTYKLHLHKLYIDNLQQFG